MPAGPRHTFRFYSPMTALWSVRLNAHEIIPSWLARISKAWLHYGRSGLRVSVLELACPAAFDLVSQPPSNHSANPSDPGSASPLARIVPVTPLLLTSVTAPLPLGRIVAPPNRSNHSAPHSL